MDPHSGLEAMTSGAILSPFTRLRRLLEGVAPGHERAIDLTLGEPREPMPAFVADRIKEAEATFAKYPAIRGSDELRGAIAAWIVRRYGPAAAVDPAREIVPVNGSREGLFYACLPAAGRKRIAASSSHAGRPAILLPNPYYAAYVGGALTVGAEPVYLNATAATRHLPDLDRLAADEALLSRTLALFLCSPANPQGAVASPAYIARALELARAYDFMLFFDECYSEIYGDTPPTGGLEVAAALAARAVAGSGSASTSAADSGRGDRFRNLVVFNSLSKRSNLPGLRSGFCAGDATFLDSLVEIRNLVGPQVPGPTQHASAAVWSEEQHVAVTRAAYRAKFDVCDAVLGSRYGYRRPAGGFFLWLDLGQFGGGEAATVTLWKRCGVKVIPGAYLAQPDHAGVNPGNDYVRVALVQEAGLVREALERMVSVLA